MVSIDFNHNPHSSCFAPQQTKVTEGGLVRVLSWYDNEWGFSDRMIDTGHALARLSITTTSPFLKVGASWVLM